MQLTAKEIVTVCAYCNWEYDPDGNRVKSLWPAELQREYSDVYDFSHGACNPCDAKVREENGLPPRKGR